jgi:hypothetical protein
MEGRASKSGRARVSVQGCTRAFRGIPASIGMLRCPRTFKGGLGVQAGVQGRARAWKGRRARECKIERARTVVQGHARECFEMVCVQGLLS